MCAPEGVALRKLRPSSLWYVPGSRPLYSFLTHISYIYNTFTQCCAIYQVCCSRRKQARRGRRLLPARSSLPATTSTAVDNCLRACHLAEIYCLASSTDEASRLGLCGSFARRCRAAVHETPSGTCWLLRHASCISTREQRSRCGQPYDCPVRENIPGFFIKAC